MPATQFETSRQTGHETDTRLSYCLPVSWDECPSKMMSYSFKDWEFRIRQIIRAKSDTGKLNNTTKCISSFKFWVTFYPLSLFLTHTLCPSHSSSFYLSLTHTHVHTLSPLISLFLSLSYTCTLTSSFFLSISLSLNPSPSLYLCLSHFLSFSHSHKHIHIYTHTYTLCHSHSIYLTHTYNLPLSVLFSLTHSLSDNLNTQHVLSLSQTHTPTLTF